MNSESFVWSSINYNTAHLTAWPKPDGGKSREPKKRLRCTANKCTDSDKSYKREDMYFVEYISENRKKRLHYCPACAKVYIGKLEMKKVSDEA